MNIGFRPRIATTTNARLVRNKSEVQLSSRGSCNHHIADNRRVEYPWSSSGAQVLRLINCISSDIQMVSASDGSSHRSWPVCLSGLADLYNRGVSVDLGDRHKVATVSYFNNKTPTLELDSLRRVPCV